jgi:alkaline phosphatase
MKSRVLSALAAAFVAVAATGTGIAISASADDDQSASLAAKIDPSRPKNVILFIGDGMGDAEVTLGRYYGKGAAGRLNMDKLPFRGSSLHYVLTPGPGPVFAPNYAGDSAPTATAWSTGKRTQATSAPPS